MLSHCVPRACAWPRIEWVINKCIWLNGWMSGWTNGVVNEPE